MMERRRELLAAKKQPRLPVEYQEVEWIGGNGMPDPTKFPYISPNVKAVSDDKFVVWFKPIQIATECPVIGQKSSPQMEIYYDSLTTIKQYQMSSKVSIVVGTPYDIVIGYGGRNTNNVYNVAYWSNEAKYVSEYRVFYLLHTRSGVPLLELIPCYRKSDGVIGMYDTVGKRFLTNAGTGSFTKGADVK